MEKDIEKAIRETLVVQNKGGMHYAVKRVMNLITPLTNRIAELEEENKKLIETKKEI